MGVWGGGVTEPPNLRHRSNLKTVLAAYGVGRLDGVADEPRAADEERRRREQADMIENMRNDLNDYLAEKEALERHSRILLGQNDDLTKELERFVNTDEVLR